MRERALRVALKRAHDLKGSFPRRLAGEAGLRPSRGVRLPAETRAAGTYQVARDAFPRRVPQPLQVSAVRAA